MPIKLEVLRRPKIFEFNLKLEKASVVFDVIYTFVNVTGIKYCNDIWSMQSGITPFDQAQIVACSREFDVGIFRFFDPYLSYMLKTILANLLL